MAPAEEPGPWLSEEAGAEAGPRRRQVAFPPAFQGAAECLAAQKRYADLERWGGELALPRLGAMRWSHPLAPSSTGG